MGILMQCQNVLKYVIWTFQCFLLRRLFLAPKRSLDCKAAQTESFLIVFLFLLWADNEGSWWFSTSSYVRLDNGTLYVRLSKNHKRLGTRHYETRINILIGASRTLDF